MQKRRLLASAALAITALGCGATSLSRTAGAAESPKQAPADNRRIAVVYFTKTGNTKSLAEAVRHMTGAALFRVETVEPYPESYGSATEIVKDELQRGVIRPIRPLAFNPDDYDVVVLGTHLTVYGAVRPQDAKVRKTAVSAARNTITDRNPTWRGLNLPTV